MAVKLNTDTSIVDYLKSQGQDSSYQNRKNIANKYGIKDYIGTAEQNTSLLQILKKGEQPKTQQTNTGQAPTVPTTPVQPSVPPAVASGVDPVIAPPVAEPVVPIDIAETIESTPANQPLNEQSAPAQYQSPYSAQIDGLLDNILNRQPFSFDLANDPMYKVYEEQYTLGANKGMRDTMGNAAALTGGYGSSYAGVAGQQTYDNHMSQLNNVVPELYNAALQQYQSGMNNDMNNLQALQSMENNAYGQYRDSVGDYQSDRSINYGKDYDEQQQQNWQNQFDYGATQDTQQQENWQSQFDYGVKQDDVANNQWQQQFDYGASQDQQQQKNWQNQFDYGKQQDVRDQQNWQSQFNYNKEQDSLDRTDAMDEYLKELETNESKESAKKSDERINKYTKSVNDMFSSTTSDEFGNKAQKHSVSDIWDFVMKSGLTDDEIAIIINDNFELRKYAEGMTGRGVTEDNRTYGYSGRNF